MSRLRGAQRLNERKQFSLSLPPTLHLYKTSSRPATLDTLSRLRCEFTSIVASSTPSPSRRNLSSSFPFLSPLSPPPSLSSLNIPAAAPTQPPMSFSFRVAAVSTSARCLAHLPPSPPTHHGTATSPSPPPPLLLLSHSSAGAPQAHASRPNRVARSGV